MKPSQLKDSSVNDAIDTPASNTKLNHWGPTYENSYSVMGLFLTYAIRKHRRAYQERRVLERAKEREVFVVQE